MTGVLETVAGRAVGEAVKPLIGRFRKQLARRGYGSSNIFIVLDRKKGAKPSHFSGLGQVWHLPQGLTQRDVEVLIKEEHFQALCRELVAVSAFGNGKEQVNKAKSRLIKLFRDRLRGRNIDPVELDSYCEQLFGDLHVACDSVATELKESVDAPQEVLTWANNVVMGDVLNSIASHLSATLADVDSDTSWVASYLDSFKERHTEIKVPDFSSRRNAPYEKLFVEPVLEELPIRISQLLRNTDRPQSVEKVSFKTFVSRIDRSVLLGDPGAGKSTSSTVAALQAAESGSIPFIVLLRNLKSPAFNLGSLLSSSLATRYQISASAAQIRWILESGRAFVVFDGLDEILHNSDRAEMTRTIEAIAARYPYLSILVT
jgi:hypothetical protein